MRLSSIQWLLCVASTAASAAKVVVLDTTRSSPHASSIEETVEPDTARLILAQRIGLAEHHSVSSADEDAIRQINAFTSKSGQQALFGADRFEEPVYRLLVTVFGADYDDLEIKNIISKDARTFSISPVPHPEDASELFKTFHAEASSSPRTTDFDTRLSSLVHLFGFSPEEAHYLDGHTAMLRFAMFSKDQYLSQVVSEFQALAMSRPTVLTFVFVPPAQKGAKPSKKPFGLAKTKSKRDSKALRAPQEKPLISADNTIASPAVESFTAPEPVSPNFASNTKVLSGPIPTCFPSLNACQKTTQNCTSHGECVLKWSTDTTNDGGSVSKQDCYGCACTKPDVRKNKDGTKKTTRYGGAACHKKDIVFPFWLLTGVTVGIIGVITFGLGMLYEMGNQELPSVIGAGVSGPKAGGGGAR